MYKQQNMGDSNTILHNCLFFTANSLARVITKMADEEFRITGLSPSHAFLLMTVKDHPGIGSKALSDHLQLAPSTVTRFVDSLVHKGLVIRRTEGRETSLTLTPDGENLHDLIMTAWKNLHDRYAAILGRKAGDEFTHLVHETSQKLMDKR